MARNKNVQTDAEKAQIKATEQLRSDLATVRVLAANLKDQNLSKVSSEYIRNFIALEKKLESGSSSIIISNKQRDDLGKLKKALDDSAKQMLDQNRNFEYQLTDILDSYMQVVNDPNYGARNQNAKFKELQKIIKAGGGDLSQIKNRKDLEDTQTLRGLRDQLKDKKINARDLAKTAPNAVHSTGEHHVQGKSTRVQRAVRNVLKDTATGMIGHGSHSLIGAALGAAGFGAIDNQFGLTQKAAGFITKGVDNFFNRKTDLGAIVKDDYSENPANKYKAMSFKFKDDYTSFIPPDPKTGKGMRSGKGQPNPNSMPGVATGQRIPRSAVNPNVNPEILTDDDKPSRRSRGSKGGKTESQILEGFQDTFAELIELNKSILKEMQENNKQLHKLSEASETHRQNLKEFDRDVEPQEHPIGNDPNHLPNGKGEEHEGLISQFLHTGETALEGGFAAWAGKKALQYGRSFFTGSGAAEAAAGAGEAATVAEGGAAAVGAGGVAAAALPLAAVGGATYLAKKGIDNYVAPVVGNAVRGIGNLFGHKGASDRELEAIQKARDNQSLLNTFSFGMLDKEHGLDLSEAKKIHDEENRITPAPATPPPPTPRRTVELSSRVPESFNVQRDEKAELAAKLTAMKLAGNPSAKPDIPAGKMLQKFGDLWQFVDKNSDSGMNKFRQQEEAPSTNAQPQPTKNYIHQLTPLPSEQRKQMENLSDGEKQQLTDGLNTSEQNGEQNASAPNRYKFTPGEDKIVDRGSNAAQAIIEPKIDENGNDSSDDDKEIHIKDEPEKLPSNVTPKPEDTIAEKNSTNDIAKLINNENDTLKKLNDTLERLIGVMGNIGGSSASSGGSVGGMGGSGGSSNAGATNPNGSTPAMPNMTSTRTPSGSGGGGGGDSNADSSGSSPGTAITPEKKAALTESNAQLSYAQAQASLHGEDSGSAVMKGIQGKIDANNKEMAGGDSGSSGSASSAATPKGLGSLSSKYEGKIGTAGGDGGRAYGKYQFDYTVGGLKRFMNDNPEYAKQFSGLQPGTQAFNDKWRAVAKADPKGFEAAQDKSAANIWYDPARKHGDKLGFHMDNRGVQEAIFSGSIQHGGINKILDTASKTPGFKNMTPQQQIQAYYAARRNYGGVQGLDAGRKAGVLKRYDSEERDALKLSTQPKEEATAASGQDQSSGKQAVAEKPTDKSGDGLQTKSSNAGSVGKPDLPAPGETARQATGGAENIKQKAGESVEQLADRIKRFDPGKSGTECVDLARNIAGMPGTVREWRKGESVLAGNMTAGTPMATFLDRHGKDSDKYDGGQGIGISSKEVMSKYGQKAGTTHALVFNAYDKDKSGKITGFSAYEQYNGSGGPHLVHYPIGAKRGNEKDAANYYGINDVHGNAIGSRNPARDSAPTQVASNAAPKMDNFSVDSPTNKLLASRNASPSNSDSPAMGTVPGPAPTASNSDTSKVVASNAEQAASAKPNQAVVPKPVEDKVISNASTGPATATAVKDQAPAPEKKDIQQVSDRTIASNTPARQPMMLSSPPPTQFTPREGGKKDKKDHKPDKHVNDVLLHAMNQGMLKHNVV